MNLVEELQGLNDSQLEVVSNLTDNLLVMAPAGTGKTKVISLRVAHFIEQGICAENILCLTFTNKASLELKERILKTVGQEALEVTVKTFHSFCFQLIREEAKSLGKVSSEFYIVDEEDVKVIIKQLMSCKDEEAKIYADYLQELKVFSLTVSQQVREESASLIEAFHHSEKGNRFYYKHKNSNEGCYVLARLSENAMLFYETYQRYMLENKLVDFNDLLIYATDLLNDDDVLIRWRQKFNVFMVDEVQDTSIVEYQLIEKIALNQKLSVFGDFNQTIYEWRNSNPELIVSCLETNFHPKVVELSLNYRSPQHLVRLSASYLENAIQARLINPTLSPKTILGAKSELGQRPVYYEAETKRDEMDFIIDHLKCHRLDNLSNTVILTRSNNQNIQVSNFLTHAGIPCYLIDKLTLFKRSGVKNLLAFIKYYLNPFDQLSLERLLPIAFETLDTRLMLSRRYKDRYTELNMRLTDLFDESSYEYEEPYGLLLRQLQQGKVVIFDVESTGLDVTKDEVIQIAAIELVDGVMVRSFERFIKPSQSVGDSALVHGFTDEYLQAHGEDAQTVFAEFQGFVQDSVLVGHNVQYDLKIVRSQMHRIGLTFDIGLVFFDTLDIVRRVYPDLVNHKLDTVSQYVGVTHEPTHNAMDDILATKDVLQKSVAKLYEHQEGRKKVIKYYDEQLKEARMILSSFKEMLECLPPHTALLALIEKVKLFECAPYVNNEQEQRNVQELLEYIEGEVLRLKMFNPRLTNWELWTLLVNQMSLSTSELDRMMKEQNKLAIITVHQSKGLEFDHVIIPFLNEGMFPLTFNDANPQEECRLFYVAMTRARQTLLLTRHLKESATSKKEKERSSFISLLYS